MARWTHDNPFRWAFSSTTAALLFLVAGSIGFKLGKGLGPLTGALRWQEGPVMWELGFGAIFAVIAAVAWRKVVRILRMSPRGPVARSR